MVLGAGLGTRLKPLTNSFPKPLVPVLGVPCIEFSLLSLLDAGIEEAVVNIHAFPLLMRSYLESNPVFGLNIKTSDESNDLLGSAGGIRKALPLLGDQPFFSLNADNISCVDLKKLEVRHFEQVQKRGALMTLVLARGEVLKNQQESYREIQVDESSGLIVGFGEKKKQVPYFTGTAVFDPSAFSHLPLNQVSEFVPQVLEPLIQTKKVAFLWMDDLWLDVGSPRLWWDAHFWLLKRFEDRKLPFSWQARIEEGLKNLSISKERGIVDYQMNVENETLQHFKNCIRLGNTIYEI